MELKAWNEKTRPTDGGDYGEVNPQWMYPGDCVAGGRRAEFWFNSVVRMYPNDGRKSVANAPWKKDAAMPGFRPSYGQFKAVFMSPMHMAEAG